MADEPNFDDVIERQKREAESRLADNRVATEKRALNSPKPRVSKGRRLFEDLPIKKQKYIAAKIENGGNQFQAAIQAGYTQAMAHKACQKIETPDVREAFKQLIREKIPANKIANVIKKGLASEKLVYATLDGKITDRQWVPDNSERRKNAELAAQLGDYWNPKATTETVHTIDPETQERVLQLYERLRIHELSFEERVRLRQSFVPLQKQNTVIDADTIATHEDPQT